MTKALQEAFEAASRLPDDEQEAIAAVLRDELADEHRWSRSFAGSQDALLRLADEALDEERTGATRPLQRDS